MTPRSIGEVDESPFSPGAVSFPWPLDLRGWVEGRHGALLSLAVTALSSSLGLWSMVNLREIRL